jgi:hypothetical protein
LPSGPWAVMRPPCTVAAATRPVVLPHFK